MRYFYRILFIITLLIFISTSFLTSNKVSAQQPKQNSQDYKSYLWIRPDAFHNKDYVLSIMTFAQRHDLALILSEYSPDFTDDYEAFRGILNMASKRGLEVWLNTGWFRKKEGYTAKVLMTNSTRRTKFMDSLSDIVSAYHSYYPAGKIFLFHEEPRVSDWGGGIKQVIRYGPAIYRAEKEAINKIDHSLAVGLFVNPYDLSKIYPDLLPKLKKLHAMPDFSFVDFYRGYRDPNYGIQKANRQLKRQIRVAQKFTGGRPVYYLGEAHTINNHYTPGKKAINNTVKAAMEAEAKGMGWYIRTAYRETDSTVTDSLKAFLPNRGSVSDTQVTNTFTFSRDRLVYAVMRTLEKTRPKFDEGKKFDLWIHGTDFDFYEAKIYLKSKNNTWNYIGNLGTYVGGTNPYNLDGKTGVVIYHALDRAKYLKKKGHGEEELKLKIVPEEQSDGMTIKGIYAMPYRDTDNYTSEPEAGQLLKRDANYGNNKSLVGQSLPHAAKLVAGDKCILKMN